MEINEKDEKLHRARHSLAHILAKALMELYPSTKLTIGPAIDDGFYYDVDLDEQLTPDHFDAIEKKMKEIINKGEPFVRKEVSRDEALKLFKGNEYKTEIINELPKDAVISLYYTGDDFFDLCSGPHVESSRNLQNYAFKIHAVNGAYWRGNEKNKMLQRVYAYAFPDKKQLNEHIAMLEEAKKRDHNKLGRELELFTTVDYIGQGLPIMLPKGAKVLQILQRFVEDEEAKRGWQLTKTPFMAKSDLYKISGHWDHYKDGMFILGDEKKDKDVYALRPMTCPFQYQAYLNNARSYKDLPLRYDETSTLFRNEASGEMHGLIRIRQFTLSEGHLMCTPEQLEDEFKGCLELAIYMLKTLGLYDDVSYRFSQWDPNNKEKYIGTEEQWNDAQSTMKKILDDLGVKYVVGVGEAAFYGPKLDIQIKNVWGKEDTLITIQIDQLLAEKFGMVYTDKDGQKKTPIIIHRSSVGCYERTLAYLIEKFAGAFPLWLAPVQVKVLTLTDRNNEYAEKIKQSLFDAGFRVELDDRNEKVGYKIREALSMKIPYLIIVGDEEEKNGTISIRGRGFENKSGLKLEDFVARMKEEVESKKI